MGLGVHRVALVEGGEAVELALGIGRVHAVAQHGAGETGALHLHQLVYRRLVRSVLHEDEAKNMLKRNNRTAPYLWSFIVLTVVPAVLFWRYSGVLLAFCVLFAVSYVAAYMSLVRFKVPRMFQRTRH